MTHQGLCHAEWCRRQVLPQPARSPLIRLAGEVRVEQKKRQTVKAIPVSTQQEGWLARRKRARAFAKSRRKGAFGLAKRIMERTAL